MELKNDLLLRTLKGETVERPPVWLMRQAGRILPQYRAIRSRLSGFIELVSTPELAAEVTIQPVDELDVDAAIIFSDILVIPEAMGLHYEMQEKVGPRFPNTIQQLSDVEALKSGEQAAETLTYVFDAVELTKKSLAGRVPLIGFSGAPWTLLAYMVEGGGSKTFSKAKRLLYKESVIAHQLLEKITETIIAYLKLKVQAGVQVIQLFDSWAGMLSPHQYRQFALPYIKQILDSIEEVPTILFSKGAWYGLDAFSQLSCNAIGLDWTIDPTWAKEQTQNQKIFQGNLDPCQLYGSEDQIEEATKKMLQAFGSRHIANLGHGVYPDTPLDNVKCFVNTVKSSLY